MSNLTAARLALFGAPVRAPRAAKPFDHMSKAEMFARIEMLERRISRARTVAANAARDAHHARDSKNREAFHAVEAALECVSPEGKE